MAKVVSLCGSGKCCPRVVVDEGRVEIGEPGNLCTLKPEEWESLREKIISGEL